MGLNAVIVYGDQEFLMLLQERQQPRWRERGEHLSEEKPSDPSEEAVPLLSASGEPEQLSEMCVDDPEPSNAVVVYGEEEFPMINQPPLSQQCVDDPVPLNAVVVYEDEEFHITNQPPMTGFIPEGETHSEDYDPLMTSSAEQEEVCI
ncbi:hypothetical protein Q7C36_017945 [Tachysurus vachellii]|uniref:Uncharacterized protein n=1 Tax=Tachysurus vachellii TaxID=175792 RepID=A0AA88LYY3_TACVA|nr:hypothetical protein Q7C36_017945 [Tachysurus vachellii]